MLFRPFHKFLNHNHTEQLRNKNHMLFCTLFCIKLNFRSHHFYVKSILNSLSLQIYKREMNFLKNIGEFFVHGETSPRKKPTKNKINQSFSYSGKKSEETLSQDFDETRSYEEAIKKIVEQREQHLNPMMSISYKANPIKIRMARGQYFYEQNGKRTLDCINNVSHIGHCHPYYVMRMQKQMNKLLTNSRFLYDEMMEATHKLLKRLPPELSVVTFTNSGSEANDLALQLAHIHTAKKGVICLQAAYHGVTRTCFEISPYKWKGDHQIAPHVTIARSPCSYRGFLANSKNPEQDYAEYIDSLINKDTGAFICEYMQSCAGQIIPPKKLYQEVYKKLRAKGVVCIGDEVQTGFGRLGQSFWAFEYYGVVPDILTIGKAMGNGFPVSAVVCTKEIAESYKNKGIEYFSTFGGNPLAVTAVSSVLDVIQWQKLQENAKTTGHYLAQRLKELYKYDFVGDIRGVGLFQGIDIVKDRESKAEDGEVASKIILMMREKGVLVSRDGVHGNVLKIKPPIVFNEQNVDELMTTFHEVMQMISH